MTDSVKHVLGVSGGRDSAALAIYMRNKTPDLDITYFFTDTGEELPEVYEFLFRLEGVLGKPIERLNPDRDFAFWLKSYKSYLPSVQARWCTRQLKLRPFEQWTKQFIRDGYTVHSYVAIRSDEEYREGYRGNENLRTILPFRDDGVDKAEVLDILERAGVGLPRYYEWRSRSGCTFCFYQQKIEWVGLLERHPEAFQRARELEKTALASGSPFTWSDNESLEDLARPERIAEIKAQHEERARRARATMQSDPLRDRALEMDDLYGSAKACLACHR
jgi:3'-phosphoadenosine 5'-phosphosulfate sulfotransferase (PAPS reductase)/FAD synthetase